MDQPFQTPAINSDNVGFINSSVNIAMTNGDVDNDYNDNDKSCSKVKRTKERTIDEAI